MKIKPEQRWYRSGALFFKFDCIFVITLNMYFVDCFNLANVKNIKRVFLITTSLYLDSKGNLCFILTTITSVRWKIRKNLIVKATCEAKYISFASFLLISDRKCGLTTCKWLLLFIVFAQFVFTEKICFIETTISPRLDQSNKIHFAASW